MRTAEMTKKWRSVLLTVVCCACAHAQHESQDEDVAQAGPASGMIWLGCGFLAVENQGSVHFTALLTGHDVRQAVRGMPFFISDGVLLEVEKTTATLMGQTTARGSDLLRSHVIWETDFISRRNHWPVLNPTIEPVQSGVPGVEALRWSYKPASAGQVLGREVASVMYVTAAIDDVVFVLSAPLRTEDDPHVVAAKLEAIVQTLRQSPTPLDVGELTKQFEAIHDQQKVCTQWGGA